MGSHRSDCYLDYYPTTLQFAVWITIFTILQASFCDFTSSKFCFSRARESIVYIYVVPDPILDLCG